MQMLSRLSSPLVAVGGVAFVLTMMMGGQFLEEQQACETDEPSTCSSVVGNPSETVLETRDGEFIAKMKSVAPADMTEFMPENAFTYEACSSRTGTALLHAGTEVTNEWCKALGCNYKQCVQKKWACNQADGTAKDPEPEIHCVAATTQTDMNPAKFVAFFFAIVVSLVMCLCGCIAGSPSSQDKTERRPSGPTLVEANNIVPSPKVDP
jgi:hypothetical protein